MIDQGGPWPSTGRQKEKTTSAIACIVLFELIRKQGIKSAIIEKQTGVSRELLNSPDARIPMPGFLKLWEMAIDATNDEALGLHLRDYFGSNLLHFVVTIALNSNTLLEAIKSWSRYDRLICDIDRISIFEQPDHFLFTYTNTAPEFENRWIPEQYFSLALAYGERISTKPIVPIEVWFRHQKPGYEKVYAKIFQCPVLFGKEQNLIRFKKADMALKVVSPDPYLKAVLVQHAEKAIVQTGNPDSVKSRVTRYIFKHLQDGEVNVNRVSDALNMDRSTLYRHLSREGTSFKELLRDIRKDLAREHLMKGLTATQTAYLLGFTEPSTFQRAFKSWFGMAPGEFKKSFQDGS